VDKNDPRPHVRLAHLLRNIHMYNCPYGLIRSDTMRKTRRHGLYPGADHVLFSELAMLGVFVEISEPLLRIRRHPGRTFTANHNPQALRELFAPGRRHIFPRLSLRTRMEFELMRGALLLPISFRERILCAAVAAWETFRAFGGRQKRKLLGTWSPDLISHS
jgi:hypothetical protein